jgi:hypothetical protein
MEHDEPRHEDGRKRDDDGDERKPGELEPHGGQQAKSERRQEPGGERRQGDGEPEPDHGVKR